MSNEIKKLTPLEVEQQLAFHISQCGRCWPEGLGSNGIAKGLCEVGAGIYDRLKNLRKGKDIDYDTGMEDRINRMGK